MALNPALPVDGTGPLAGLLAGLGVTSTQRRDTVEDQVLARLAERGMTAQVASLRYGTLVLTADPQTAALLRYDTAALLAELNATLQEPVKSVQVRVSRPS